MKGMLYQNLVDAGCPAELTEECMALAADGKERQMLVRLKAQRKCLLDEIHTHQKELDCLDYLVFCMENKS